MIFFNTVLIKWKGDKYAYGRILETSYELRSSQLIS